MSKMFTVEQVTPRAIRAIMPKSFDGMSYIKLSEGMEKTIVKVAFSVYPAKDKATKEEILRKDGSVVTKTTAYVGFDDGTYSTVGNEYAIGQLFSITETIGDDDVGMHEYPDIEPCKVRITTKDIKYGDKLYPSWVFIPIERFRQMDITTLEFREPAIKSFK